MTAMHCSQNVCRCLKTSQSFCRVVHRNLDNLKPLQKAGCRPTANFCERLRLCDGRQRELKIIINWRRLSAKPYVSCRFKMLIMKQEYIDDKFCEHCQKETSHKRIDSGHERDSSGDYYECLECHWWGMGMSDEYYPPSDVSENGS